MGFSGLKKGIRIENVVFVAEMASAITSGDLLAYSTSIHQIQHVNMAEVDLVSTDYPLDKRFGVATVLQILRYRGTVDRHQLANVLLGVSQRRNDLPRRSRLETSKSRNFSGRVV